jgi:hypothetical protein
MLVGFLNGDVARIREVEDFVTQNERYLLHLAQDHTSAGMGIVADLLETAHALPESTLISAHFGSSYADGQDALGDLQGSGLLLRDSAALCALGAELFRQSRAMRAFVRAPEVAIPTLTPGEHAQAAAVLYGIENRLREFIVDALRVVDRAWWPTRIPVTLVGEAESRRRQEMESPSAPDDEMHPIMYLTLGELVDVMFRAENWDDVFNLRLRRPVEATRAAAQDISAVRNKVAHNRPVAPRDIALAEAAARVLRLT